MRSIALLLSAATPLFMSACDVDVFGADEKKIAGGCRLYLREDGGFSLIPPGSTGGEGVAKLGWRKPFIVAVMGDGLWEVFDTERHSSELFLPAEQIRADARVRNIPLIAPDAAWKQLHYYSSLW